MLNLTLILLKRVTPDLPTWATTVTFTSQLNALWHIHNYLHTIIPENFNQELRESTKTIYRLIKINKNVQYLSLAVYLLTNNILYNEKATIIAKIFQNKRNMQFLKSLLLIQSLTVKAFIKKLFLGIIKSKYPSII